VGIGDTFFSLREADLRDILAGYRGCLVEFDNHANRPRASYVAATLSHLPGRPRDPSCFYVGQALNDELLSPEQDDTFTIFVDHPYKGCSSTKVLEIAGRARALGKNVRVWH
jgi:hypothetical protein